MTAKVAGAEALWLLKRGPWTPGVKGAATAAATAAAPQLLPHAPVCEEGPSPSVVLSYCRTHQFAKKAPGVVLSPVIQ